MNTLLEWSGVHVEKPVWLSRVISASAMASTWTNNRVQYSVDLWIDSIELKINQSSLSEPHNNFETTSRLCRYWSSWVMDDGKTGNVGAEMVENRRDQNPQKWRTMYGEFGPSASSSFKFCIFVEMFCLQFRAFKKGIVQRNRESSI